MLRDWLVLPQSLRSRREMPPGTRMLQELLPEYAYHPDERLFFLEDQYLGFAFLCAPRTSVSESDAESFQGLLNQNWPPGAMMQVIHWASPDIEPHLQASMDLRQEATGTLYETVRQRGVFYRQGLYESLGDPSGPRVRNHYVIVAVKVPTSEMPGDREIREAGQLRRSLMQSLKTVEMYPIEVTAGIHIRLVGSMLNWQPQARWRDSAPGELYDPQYPVGAQIPDLDARVVTDVDGLRFGSPERPDAYAKVIGVKRYPEYLRMGLAGLFSGKTAFGTRGLHEHFLLTLTLYFPNSENQREVMDKKRNWSARQATEKMLQFMPELARRKADYDALFEALDDGDRPVQGNLTLVLFAESREAVEAASTNAQTYYRELGFQVMEDRWFCRPLFFNALPLGADPQAIQLFGRYNTMGTRHAVRLLPVISDWRGTGTPTLQFISRGGQLMNVCLFDSDTNYNACIAAQSGAGKSFLTNEILVSYLSQGAQCWVIDVGRSYVKTTEVLDGEFMVFDDQSDIQLNPFPLVQDYKEEEDALVGLLTSMACDREMLSDLQSAGLKRILGEQWQIHGRDLTIDKLAEALLDEDDTRIQDVGKQLFPFTSQGGYGRFFNRGNNVDLDNPFMVLELEELKGRKHLQRVVLLQLIYQIQQEMYLGDRGKRKLLIIDESWDLMAEPSVARFIEGGYRRFRKYNGAAIVITQSINDLYNSPTGVAIAENSANLFLLNQKASSIDHVQREGRLPLSESGYDVLKTVHTQKGKYSEIFFLTETKGAGIGRLIGSRYVQLLYSTDAREIAAINAYREHGLSYEDAIKAVIEEERKKGDV